MYIVYYFFRFDLCSFDSGPITYLCAEGNLFLDIWIIWFILVTLLSLINSRKKKEDILPKSIRYIIVNLIFIWITFFTLISKLPFLYIQYIIPISFLFYWLLIIVSRFSIPYFIRYFWFIIFASWLLIMWPLLTYANEIVLVILWFGHLIISVLLWINNNKNG